MYTLPQEIEVWYIIPAIRRELSECMVNTYKVPYQKVGDALGISKAAVSQYIKKKRAAKIKLHPKVRDEVCSSCNAIIKNRSDAVTEIQRILKIVREKNFHCEKCGEINEGKLHNCVSI